MVYLETWVHFTGSTDVLLTMNTIQAVRTHESIFTPEYFRVLKEGTHAELAAYVLASGWTCQELLLATEAYKELLLAKEEYIREVEQLERGVS